MKTPRQSAFTLIEMLVVISIIAILAAFAVPALTSALTKGQMTGTMNNARQLYLAGQQMALDGSANSDPNLGWPADVGDTTLEAYAQRLVRNDYLKAGDVSKLLSGPGAACTATFTGSGTTGTLALSGAKSALKVYPVAEAMHQTPSLLLARTTSTETISPRHPEPVRIIPLVTRGSSLNAREAMQVYCGKPMPSPQLAPPQMSLLLSRKLV